MFYIAIGLVFIVGGSVLTGFAKKKNELAFILTHFFIFDYDYRFKLECLALYIK